MTPRVGIVVLSWNGGAQTLACVESARAQTYAEKFILLVDNDSGADERAALRQRYGGVPEIECCFLDSNRGYAGGNNVGIAAALERGAELVVILTQDATLRRGALAALVETARADPRIGIVAPAVIDTHSQRVLSIGERVSVPCLCVPRTLLRYRHARASWYPVTGVLGCVMLLTRGCAVALRGFDDGFFAYYEEVDLCLRARARGFVIACTPAAVATHDGMRGFLGGFTPLSAELKARNLVRIMRRHARTADWMVLLPTAALLFAGSAIGYALRCRFDIVAALVRGVTAGVRQQSGPLAAAVPPR